jgi:anhydro-N-acetylmuramic acid kinase
MGAVMAGWIEPSRRGSQDIMRILGFMSGTSLDAVDMAVIETDGEAVTAYGPAGERKLSEATRALALAATKAGFTWARGTPEPTVFAEAARAIAHEHLIAAQAFMASNSIATSSLDLAGFHGQTVLHERPKPGVVGRTVQLGDARLLAEGLGIPVAYDFRTADVAAGGQGAPLAPIYHAALVRRSNLTLPVAVLNLGGVANITLIPHDTADLQAFDTGPANGMIDLLVQERTGARYDQDGALAAAGKVDDEALAALLAHPYFSETGPKSLDRYDFSLDPVRPLSLEDACATLTAFTAAAIGLAVVACRETPTALVACGGGRHNPTLMRMIADHAGVPVMTAEDAGWRGDAIEAEAFAYLAARTKRGLPISFPGTTGVVEPMTGGRIVEP